MAVVDLTRIDLPTIEFADLADHAIEALRPEEPFGLYCFAGDDPRAELGRWVERQVFGEVFGDSAELLAAEYGPYEEASAWFVVLDHARRVPAGALRLIVGPPEALKSWRDLRSHWGITPDGVVPDWDIATLAVQREYQGAARSGPVSLALVQGMATTFRACRCDVAVTILDTPVLRFLQSQICRPFSSFEGVHAKPYLGSTSSKPVYCRPAEWEERTRQADPAMHALLFEGSGLEAVIRPPRWDDVERLIRGVTRVQGRAVSALAAMESSTAGMASLQIGRE